MMKKLVAVIGIVPAVFLWSQETVSSTIVLPDVKIVLEGDTSIPLQDQTNVALSGQDIDFGRVDLAELSRLRRTEYYKTELAGQRQSPSFSLSSFRLFYGTSENLLSDMTVGKRVDKLNYLVSYLRHSRGSLLLTNTRLYNTELKLDDINVDVIMTLSPQLEWQIEIGYYDREMGLYTNAWALSEKVRYFPARVGLSWTPDTYSLFTMSFEGNYLERENKLLSTAYTNFVFYHFSPSVLYEASWAKDNFLRLDGRYLYSVQDRLFHEGEVGFLDRMNVLSSLSLDVGTRLYFSSRDPFFWYPLVMIRYRYTDRFVFTAGIDGERKRWLGGDMIEENQYLFTTAVHYDRWTPQASVQYIPAEGFSLKGSVAYQFYSAYPSPLYLAQNDMFTYEQKTNVSLVETGVSLDWSPVKSLMWKTTASYVVALSREVTEVSPFSLSSLAEWKWQEIGLTTTLKGVYYPRVRTASGADLPDAILVSAGLSQRIGRDFYLEVVVENLLNQNHFRRPCVPEGGLQLMGGIRILL